ncbi:MAG: YihY/virulence factor BrkB family protein [Bacteroidota bacterium]
MRAPKTAWELLKTTFSGWSDDKAPRLGAALSYYTAFSLAPVLIVVISVAGLAFGQDAAQGRIVEQLQGVFGREAAEVIQTMLAKANEPRSGVIGVVVGFVTLLVGATGVVIELQDALNTVWKVIPKPGRGIKGLIKDRILSFALILGFGFLLLVSLVASAGLEAMGGVVSRFIPGWVILGYILNYAVSLLAITSLIAMIFKFLPDARVAWRDVWIGAFATSVLFHVGKYLIGLYVGRAGVGSPFGAAGALAVLLVWIYYTAQIILLGAEFTKAYANRLGGHVVPSKDAVAAPETPLARLALEKQLKDQHAKSQQKQA